MYEADQIIDIGPNAGVNGVKLFSKEVLIKSKKLKIH